MEICPPAYLFFHTQLGHEDSCNCCCCSNPQPAYLKYVQPPVPKSFKPVRYYWRNDIPFEANTTYKLSYWDGPTPSGNSVKPVLPEDSLTVGDGNINDETIHKLSYIGNWCVKREIQNESAPRRTVEQWLGTGPMQDNTTNKDAYTWKSIARSKPFKVSNNLYCPCASIDDNTTYKLSYYESGCGIPVSRSFKPKKIYTKSDVPMDGCTTYKLSYWPYETPCKETHPWNQKIKYHEPLTPLDDSTIYKLSYWPNNQRVRKPFSHSARQTNNLLNTGQGFDENTTYKLSYFACGDNVQRKPIKPVVKPSELSKSPLADDTVHKLSYLGNYRVKPEQPIIPSSSIEDWFESGPMQNSTTQKNDFSWKCSEPGPMVSKPEDNLGFSSMPLECCTTHKLSYYPNDLNGLVKNKSFKPPRENRYRQPDVPFEGDTIMQLSYQPVDCYLPRKKPWAQRTEYHPPLTSMEDNTIYNQRFFFNLYIPPGTLETLPCDQPRPQLPSDMGQDTRNVPPYTYCVAACSS
ncbi:uncharacterized protein LOC103574578 [Microplitis demolitor]|uniref:uncharacterized protein LOC103574578 n=1 Tax=Microplitis demolitor TaxID=69319 RepID=UPI00235B6C0A|nr:uncharacterized protein LOC103574578 [Microplitis demolitor]